MKIETRYFVLIFVALIIAAVFFLKKINKYSDKKQKEREEFIKNLQARKNKEQNDFLIFLNESYQGDVEGFLKAMDIVAKSQGEKLAPDYKKDSNRYKGSELYHGDFITLGFIERDGSVNRIYTFYRKHKIDPFVIWENK